MYFRLLKEHPDYTKELLHKLEINSDWTRIYHWLKEQTELTMIQPLPDITLAFECDELIGFLVLTEYEKIQEQLNCTPFLGQVLIFDGYRGKGYSKQLIEHAAIRAKELGYNAIYLTTQHQNLYERYGYEHIQNVNYIWNEQAKLYRKDL